MKATLGLAAEVQSAAKARKNDDAPGVQPEAPSRAVRTRREARGKHDMSHSVTTEKAPSTPTDQPQAHVNGVQVPVAESATGSSLTPEQVCDLPLDDLLTQLHVDLDTVDTDQPHFAGLDFRRFFGYMVVRASSITVFTREAASEVERDIAIRYMLTQHLGLPTHLFPAEMQHTVYVGPNHDEVTE